MCLAVGFEMIAMRGRCDSASSKLAVEGQAAIDSSEIVAW